MVRWSRAPWILLLQHPCAGMVAEPGARSRGSGTRIQVPALVLPGCVMLGQCPHLSEPPVPACIAWLERAAPGEAACLRPETLRLPSRPGAGYR